MRPRSFAGPVLLIGIGLIFLVNNLRPDLSLWRLIGDYWPFALIIFGIIRVIEVLVAFQSGTPPQNGRVRPMGFGWIFAIVIFGLIASLPHRFGPGFHLGHLGSFRTGGVDFFGEEFEYPLTQSASAPGVRRIVLDNIHGTVSINGVEGTDVHVEGHKMIRAFDRPAADGVNSISNVSLATEGDTLYVRSTEPVTHDNSRISLDLQISVPAGINLEARGRSGDLSINSIRGNVDVSSQRGEVRLSDIGGNAKLDIAHCELVRASNLKGAFDLEGNGREVQLDTVGGQVTINGRYSGNMEFRNLAMPLKFKSDQTDLRVEKVTGSINMDLNDFRATNLGGPIHFVTHSRDIHLEDFSGPLEIEVGSGDLDLRPAKGPIGRIDARTRKGNIDVALPQDGNFDLKASTGKGEISNDYGSALVSDTSGHTSILRSAQPHGSSIALATERGEVSIRKIE